MSDKNANSSAFTLPDSDANYMEMGLTKREYFAGQVVAGYMANSIPGVLTPDKIAPYIIEVTDALLEELDK